MLEKLFRHAVFSVTKWLTAPMRPSKYKPQSKRLLPMSKDDERFWNIIHQRKKD